MAENIGPRTIVTKKLGSFRYSSGQRDTLNLDRDGMLYQLAIRCRFTITNGGTGPVGPLFATLARIIRRFELTLNGKDTIINLDGQHIASRAFLENGSLPLGLNATVVLTNSAATNYDITLPINLFLPRAVSPQDTGLECRTLQQLTASITFASTDCSDFFTTPNSAALSNVQIELSGKYQLNTRIRDVSDPAYFIRALDMVNVTNSASNANLQLQHERGPQFYRSFHFLTQRGNVGVDTILNSFRLTTGSWNILEQDAPVNRAEILSQFGLYAAPAADVLLTGVYHHNLSMFGSLETTINVSPDALKTDLFNYFNTTYTSGVETINVSREAIRKPNIG